MTVREIVAQAAGTGLAPLLKDRGFGKKGLAFRRRLAETEQVVALELSRGNTSSTGSFYVNVGVSFDALAALGGTTSGSVVIAGKPWHFARRLEELSEGAPPSWTLDAATDPVALGARLASALEPALALLDATDSPWALLCRVPLDRGFERVLRARLRYTAGEFSLALEDLEGVASEFQDRGLSVAALIRQTGLEKLNCLL
jgi:hypothetical protein